QAEASAPHIKLRLMAAASNFAFNCDSYEIPPSFLSISMKITTHLFGALTLVCSVLFYVLIFSILNCVLVRFAYVMNRHMRYLAYWQTKASAPHIKLRLMAAATNFVFNYDSYETPSGFLSISMKATTHLFGALASACLFYFVCVDFGVIDL
ncbi:hypothetical protein, partial [Psychromonas arctica]|uniref:hypothetical protein n=1 Tax=Psychromonas arctica TaxID=168275 RepID=UPI002FD1B4C7